MLKRNTLTPKQIKTAFNKYARKLLIDYIKDNHAKEVRECIVRHNPDNKNQGVAEFIGTLVLRRKKKFKESTIGEIIRSPEFRDKNFLNTINTHLGIRASSKKYFMSIEYFIYYALLLNIPLPHATKEIHDKIWS